MFIHFPPRAGRLSTAVPPRATPVTRLLPGFPPPRQPAFPVRGCKGATVHVLPCFWCFSCLIVRHAFQPGGGMEVASGDGMGVHDFTDLVCWQLARELKLYVLPFADRPAVLRDFKFRGQLIDAASSATRNIAEGFGRYDHKEFALFMKFALGSESETRDNLIDAFDKKYISQEEMDAGLKLAKRAIAAGTKFRQYLLTTPTPPPKPPRNLKRPAPDTTEARDKT